MADEEKTMTSPSPTQPEPEGAPPTSETPPLVPLGQLIVSLAGGAIGIGLFVVGVAIAALRGIFSLWPLVFIGGSLALYALLIAWDRKQEQKSAAVRRTLHGYNVFLMSGLLLVVLGVVNVMVFTYGSEPIDMTSLRVHSLAPQTERLLESLKEKVLITVLYPERSRDLLGQDVEYVLTQRMLQDSLLLYSQHSPQIEVKYVDPYQDPTIGRELITKYPDISVPCILVEYGPGESPEHEVLKHTDLVEVSRGMMDESPNLKNKSEDAITSALTRLTEGERSTKIYFATGNGELDPEDATESSERGIGLFKGRLESLGVVVATYQPESTPKVPDDADIVIVAGPQQPFSQAAVQAMIDYLNRGGKMILLADIITNPVTGKPVDLGLGPLLERVNVTLGDEAIRFLQEDLFGRVFSSLSGYASPTDVQLQLVSSLGRRPVTFYESREVAAARQSPPTPGAPSAEPYQVTSIVEGGVPASELQKELDKNLVDELFRRRTSLGVAVSENKGAAPPPMPGHPPLPNQQDSEPRLVVLGDAEFAANAFLTRQGGSGGFTLLMGSVNWLRGRLELLGIEPKERKATGLAKSKEERWAMVWKPTVLFLCFFVAAGIAVWKVRHTA
jgi:hypothetical protein